MQSKLPKHTLFELTQRVKSKYHDRLTREQVKAVRTVLKKYTELATSLKREFGWNSNPNYKTIGNPIKLMRVLKACEADARGRLGYEDRDYTLPKQVMADYARLSALDYEAITKNRRFPKDAVIQARVNALK